MLFNGKPINPGELRTLITLEKPTISTDAGGGQDKTYASQGQVWSRWVNAHGQEAVQDGAMQTPKRAKLLIRYRSDIDATWAVSKGSERYQIIAHPDDIQERHEYMELQVQLMVWSS